MKYLTIINNQNYEVEITGDGKLFVNGVEHTVDFLSLADQNFSIIKDYKSFELAIEEAPGGKYEILLGGRLYDAQVLDERALLMANRKGGLKFDGGDVASPMPGLIVAINVQPGDVVEKGQTLAILESMKMQNELKAPRPGTITAIHVAPGQTVDKGAILIVIGD